jgi:phospholipase C
VLPGPITSDHPGVPAGYCGPSWAAQVVDAIGNSKYWDDTAIVIFWDDWGGFYDHVAPYVVRDQAGPGFRVPLLVVSKYAKRGYVSHSNGEFGTLLKFAEENFHLGSLGTTDASPYVGNLDDYFDWNNPKPFTHIDTQGYLLCDYKATAQRNRLESSSSRWLRMIDADD